jgi:hypothetical protein
MIPEDWLEYMAQAEKQIKKTPDPLKKHKPKVTRHMSRRMRTVSGQTPNPIRAMYVPENEYNRTPTIEPEKHTLTREVGPHDQYNPDEAYRGGKATVEPTKSNKRAYPGRRTNGGGDNKSIEALTEEFMKGFGE